MAKVTVIAYSKGLHNKNFAELRELAKRLGKIRAEVWRKYGSIQGVGLHHRTIRDEWMSNNRLFDVQARLWKETLRDTVYDIKTYREATKVIVRKAISERTKDNEERKRLYTLLKYDRWSCDNFLRRKMRKYFKHGITKVDNQIVLDPCCYTTFEHNGKAWLKVMGINRGKRITIPLNTNHTPQGMLRLILRDGKIEVHYARDVEEVCSIKAHGEKVIGIDKGYTEVFVDSEGNEHGDKLGELLTSESDFLKDKYRNRNKISAVRDAKLHKQRAIDLNNMGCKKLNARKSKHTKRVRDKIFKAAHSVVDHAKIVVCEDLTANIKGRSYGKDQNRRLSGWVKGIIAEAIESVSQRRGSTLVKVNAAYTSQIDSRYGVLLGTRKGDLFYCFDGVVLDADLNAARNILSRLYDSEIQLYTPYKDVKRILLKRTEQFKQRLGLLNQDSSCNEKSLSTESELPF